MTGIFIFICAVILSTCVSHPFAHARQEEIIINLQSNETKILNSPNLRSRYDDNIDIMWHVRAPSGYRIMVHFSEFNTEPGRDFIYVYDGITSENRSSDPRKTFSGRSVPRDITTVGAYLWIRFTIDDWFYVYLYRDYPYYGFRAVLTTVETTVIMLDTIETEIITSPNFPANYDNNIDVALQLIAPSGYRVHVHFRNFESEANSDFVFIYEGWTLNFSSSTLRASLSGRSIPDNITSMGSYLWIRITSNERKRFKGFQALLNAKIPVIMLDTIETEIISSPNFPANYDNNIDIVLQLIAPSGYRVHVHFRNFESEANSDFVYIYEGWTSNFSNSTLVASLSGRSIPDNITSMGSYIWIRFTSNERNRSGGIQALLNAKVPGPGRNVTSRPVTTGPTSTANSTATSSESPRGLSLVTILSSTVVPLFAVAIIVLIVCLLCRRKGLKHGSSQGITASGEPRESLGMKDNSTFESPNVHDLRMAEVMGRHGGNDPYMALTTPNVCPTVQVYEPLREVNFQGDVYEVPVNRANGQTGPEFGKTLHKLQVHPEDDYEITHEYQDLTISVVERNYSRNESPIHGLHVQHETEYEVIHESEYMNVH